MAERRSAIRAGMCSVTLRRLSVVEVVRVAVASDQDVLEWGADVHVPPGDLAAARHARRVTEDAGLRVAAYGSYFRAGASDPADWAPILDSARTLGAPRIRVWAGTAGSAEATPEDRERVVAASRTAADRAADHGIMVAFEFHGATLTDDAHSALRLVREVDRTNVATYWQPPVGIRGERALNGLEVVIDHVPAVHVFSWWPARERLRLDARAPLWRSVFARLAATGRAFDALLEFVPDDDAALVPEETRTLRDLAGGAR